MSRVELRPSIDVDDAANGVAEGGGVPAGRRALPHRSLLASREAEELADRRQLVEHLKRKMRGEQSAGRTLCDEGVLRTHLIFINVVEEFVHGQLGESLPERRLQRIAPPDVDSAVLDGSDRHQDDGDSSVEVGLIGEQGIRDRP